MNLDTIRALLRDLDIGSGMSVNGRYVFHGVDHGGDGHDYYTIDDEAERFRLTLETAARDLADFPDIPSDEGWRAPLDGSVPCFAEYDTDELDYEALAEQRPGGSL